MSHSPRPHADRTRFILEYARLLHAHPIRTNINRAAIDPCMPCEKDRIQPDSGTKFQSPPDLPLTPNISSSGIVPYRPSVAVVPSGQCLTRIHLMPHVALEDGEIDFQPEGRHSGQGQDAQDERVADAPVVDVNGVQDSEAGVLMSDDGTSFPQRTHRDRVFIFILHLQ